MKTQKKNTRTAKRVPCDCLSHTYDVRLTVMEVLTLVIAATEAVQRGWDDDEDVGELLEEAVNNLLNTANVDCAFSDGAMTLTYLGVK